VGLYSEPEPGILKSGVSALPTSKLINPNGAGAMPGSDGTKTDRRPSFEGLAD